MEHIHYEDGNTRYICIGPINKAMDSIMSRSETPSPIGPSSSSPPRKRKEPVNKVKCGRTLPGANWKMVKMIPNILDATITTKECYASPTRMGPALCCITARNVRSTLAIKKTRKVTRLTRDNVSGGTGYRRWNKKRCDDKCIEIIIKDELPFRFVEREGFRALYNELEPQWTVLNRKQVATEVLEKFKLCC